MSKHVTIVSELSRLIGVYQLFEVSETEQNLVCQNNHQEIVQVSLTVDRILVFLIDKIRKSKVWSPIRKFETNKFFD